MKYPTAYIISPEVQAKELEAVEAVKNWYPETSTSAISSPKPVKEMSDIYEHLKAKLNFHTSAINTISQHLELSTTQKRHVDYHQAEADDIRHCINWLEVKHGLRSLNDE